MIIIGCSITFIATILGAAIVFFFKEDFSGKTNSIISGFSAGVMVAASIWGLLLPSISYASYLEKFSFLPALVGVIVGSLFLVIIDAITKHINNSSKNPLAPEKLKLTRFVIAFTVHNIPEGLAVGFAFGTALASASSSSFFTAMGLAIGIAIQNIPEGAAVALPVYKQTGSKAKGFLWGTISGIVEPIFAVLGVLLASTIEALLPWFLAFSAGAMIFVSIEDLIPEAKYSASHLGTWSFILGFLVMMVLDIALG